MLYHVVMRFAWCVILAFVPFLCGQVPPANPGLEMVDQGVEDVDPLRKSFRFMPVDLRMPAGFQNVYHVPGDDERYMRVSGAIHAVFPRSQYQRTRQGILVEVPAGTVYYIGLPLHESPPVDLALERAADDRVDNLQDTRAAMLIDRAIDSRLDTRVDEASEDAARSAKTSILTDRRPVAPTVANNERYRVQRVSSLVERAASAAMKDDQQP